MKEIIEKSLNFFNGDPLKVKLLGGFNQNVYQTFIGSIPIVVKILSKKQTQKNRLISEIEWVNHLNRNGANVNTFLLSKNGNWIEEIEVNEESYYVVCLKKIKGEHPVPGKLSWNAELFQSWGRLMGTIHNISRNDLDLISGRREWYEQEIFSHQLLMADPAILEKWEI